MRSSVAIALGIALMACGSNGKPKPADPAGDKVADDKPPSVVMKVLHGIHTRFVEIEPSWETF